MKQSEMQQVGARLAELAEFYDRKPPTPNALKVWADAFTGCSLADVMDVLTDWPRSKRAFPIASEVVEGCQARNAERHHALSKRSAEPVQLVPRPRDPNSPAYLRFKAWRAAFKANPPPCPYPDRVGSFIRVGALLTSAIADLEPNPDAWWQSIITGWRNGEQLAWAQMEMATEAWINAHRPSDWTPPDVEAQLEREAIQNE